MNTIKTMVATLRGHFQTNDLSVLFVNIALQLTLALLFGHLFEARFNLATGYLVGTGQNPYVPQDLSGIFHNHYFQGITSIGYPPPIPLLLGFIYLCTFKIFPCFLFYNFSSKIPVIAANICLAYVVAAVLTKSGSPRKVSRKAWLFMLFNPFILYASTAWGQFDSVVALISLISSIMLYSGLRASAGILLALAISFKPIALPLLPVAFIYLFGRPFRQKVEYFASFIATLLLFCAAPFFIFSWDPSMVFLHWNAHFSLGGCMSYLSFLEIMQNGPQLPSAWKIVGFLWIPGLIIASFALKSSIRGPDTLLKNSIALIMVFYLTRTWLSEPNLVLLLPFMVLATSRGLVPQWTLTALWTLPLLFGIFNESPALLLFPTMPDAMDTLLKFGEQFRNARLIIRSVVVIPWLLTGCWIVIYCCNHAPTGTKFDAGAL